MHALADRPDDRLRADEQSRFQFQCELFEEGFEQVQEQIRTLDEILFKIKAGGVTVWVVLVGWAFQTGLIQLLPLGFAVLAAFWILEGMFRAVQLRYIAKSRELSAFSNDVEALDECFSTRTFPPGLVYPVGLRESERKELKRFALGLLSGTVLSLYLMLALANVCIVLAAPLIMAAS